MKEEKFFANPVIRMTFEFSLMILKFIEILETQRKYVIANQLLKSATSIGANCMEAQNAESRADFIHKIKIAAKESEETQYWLMLCNHSPSYPDAYGELNKLQEINRMLGKIIHTFNQNSKSIK